MPEPIAPAAAPRPAYPPAFAPDLPDQALLSAVVARTGLSPADLALKFDSLGDNCELGLVQRRCGAEPLGLFRFANPGHEPMLRLIETDFRNYGSDMLLELDQQAPRREWILVDHRTGVREHTNVWDGEQAGEALRLQQVRRLEYLRGLMLDNIRRGTKIFVLKSSRHKLSVSAVLPLARALRRRGPTWLLWVEPGTDVGRVEVLTKGLMRGTIDRLAGLDAVDRFSFAGWLAVMTGAWQTLRAAQDGPA